MIKKFARIVGLGVLAAGMSVVLPAGALPPGNNINQNSVKEITVACIEAGSSEVAGWITFQGETRLWPPNHKYRDSLIAAVDEDNFHANENFDSTQDPTNSSNDPNEADGLNLLVTATDSNTLGGYTNGSGNPSKENVIFPDGDSEADLGGTAGDGASDVTVSVQAERSGRDRAGRIYNLKADARFSDSDTDDSSEDTTRCQVEFHVCVPHDMRKATRGDECPNVADGSTQKGTAA